MKRYLARRVVMLDGSEHGLSIVTIDDEGGVSVVPFEREIAATSYHSGTIRITPQGILFE